MEKQSSSMFAILGMMALFVVASFVLSIIAFVKKQEKEVVSSASVVDSTTFNNFDGGTLTSPGITFEDNQTGFYKVTNGGIGMVISGENVATIGGKGSSALAFNTKSQGILPPRMTTIEKNAIVSPEAGLLIFDTTFNRYEFFDGIKFDSLDPPQPSYDFDNVKSLLNSKTEGFGAGSIWRTREEGFSYKEAAFNATDNHVTTSGGVKLYVLIGGEGSVNAKAFGAIGDGVVDDTLALQAAIDFAAPYDWQGTVEDTNNAQQVRCALVLPVGTYRVTTTLKLSKGLHMYGKTGSGDFSTSNQAVITADFDNMDGYILDTAPYNTGGNRILSKIYSGTELKNNTISTTNSIILNHISLTVTEGRTVMGGINMTISDQSIVENCGFTNVNVGIRLSGSKAGSFQNNYISAKAQGIYCVAVASWIISNNYIALENDPDPGYVWPSGATGGHGFLGETQILSKYACILMYSSSPKLYHNTLELGNIGIAAESCQALNVQTNYMKDIVQWCYALHLNDAHIIGGFTDCPTAKLLWASGESTRSTVLDFRGVSTLSVLQDAFEIEFINTVTFKTDLDVGFFFNNSVHMLTSNHEKGYNPIYVSSTGSDTNNGLSESYPVLTLKGAYFRLRQGFANEIIIIDAQTIETKSVIDIPIPYDITIRSSAENALRATINVNTTVADQTDAIHMLSGKLFLRDINIVLPAVTDANNRAFIRSRGPLSVTAIRCTFTGQDPTTSAVFGAAADSAPILNISTVSCTFTNVHFIQDSAGSILWSENNSGSTFTNVTTDTGTKIASKFFV